MFVETGWVIEHEDSDVFRPLFLTLKDQQIGWSYEHLDAFRMSRFEDAKAFADVFLRGQGRFCEHGWSL